MKNRTRYISRCKNGIFGRAGFFVAFILLLLPSTGGANITSTFDTDLDGWHKTGCSDLQWSSTDGNPGGCLVVDDDGEQDRNYAVAPHKFLGDWSHFNSPQTLSFDIKYDLHEGYYSPGPFLIRIGGPGGVATVANPSFPENQWKTIVVTVDPDAPVGWTLVSGSWHDLLSNVTSLRINAEFVFGREHVYIDNVELSDYPSSVFDSCAYADFNNSTNTGDWMFQGTANVYNFGEGGNSGGYVRVHDTLAEHGYAYVPPYYLVCRPIIKLKY